MIESASSTRPSATVSAGHPARVLLAHCMFVAVYILVAQLTRVRPLLQPGITPWDPAIGLAIVFLARYGWSGWPAMFFASAMAKALHSEQNPSLFIEVVTCAWISTAYVATARIVSRRGWLDDFDSSAKAGRFAIAIALSTLCVALGLCAIYAVADQVARDDTVLAATRRWFADMTGIMLVTPLVSSIQWNRSPLSAHLQRARQTLLPGAMLVAFLAIFFSLPATEQLRFFYVLFVPVIWIALRWRWRGAVLAVLLIQVGLIAGVENQLHAPRFVDLQLIVLTLSLTGFLLGSVVAERSRVLNRAQAEEAQQRALLEMAPDAIFTIDSTGAILAANSTAKRMFALTLDKDVKLSALLPNLSLLSMSGEHAQRAIRSDGSQFDADVAWTTVVTPSAAVSLIAVRDATQRRRREEETREHAAHLSYAMRFATAGELASALAHELNQPITAALSYLQAAEILAGAQADERLRSTLTKAVVETKRSATVLQRLRNFYRGHLSRDDEFDVRTSILTIVESFQERLRQNGVSLELDLAQSRLALRWDATQLEIVLHNLLSNAVDAVAKRPSAKVKISATADEANVVIVVEDSGAGVDASQKNIFEPFVTSKAEGMGLGLSISRSLLRARGGVLSFDESPAFGGARFTVTIPSDPSHGSNHV